MKKFDDVALRLCKIQAEIFEKSLTKLNCSSLIFIRRFMYSQLACRMDSDGFIFEACDVNDAIDEINGEFGDSNYGIVKYSESELYWIGYIYRYWAYTYQMSSKQVYRIVKPKELQKLYFPYHSLDPAQAIERILEAKGMKDQDEDMISKGVQVMRRILKEKKEGR